MLFLKHAELQDRLPSDRCKGRPIQLLRCACFRKFDEQVFCCVEIWIASRNERNEALSTSRTQRAERFCDSSRLQLQRFARRINVLVSRPDKFTTTISSFSFGLLLLTRATA